MRLALVTAAVTLRHVHHPRYVTAEAHGQGCGLRASTSPHPPPVSSYSRARHVPHNLPLRFTVGLPLHSRRPSSISLCCQGSVPLPPLRSSVPRLLRSGVILPLGNRPPALVRFETNLILPGVQAHCYGGAPALTPLRPKAMAEAMAYEPPLRSLRSAVISKSPSHLHPAYQKPSATGGKSSRRRHRSAGRCQGQRANALHPKQYAHTRAHCQDRNIVQAFPGSPDIGESFSVPALRSVTPDDSPMSGPPASVRSASGLVMSGVPGTLRCRYGCSIPAEPHG